MTTTNLTVKDVMRLIKAASSTGISRLQWGALILDFSPQPTKVASDSPKVRGAAARQSEDFEEDEDLEEDEELQELFYSDYAEFERRRLAAMEKKLEKQNEGSSD